MLYPKGNPRHLAYPSSGCFQERPTAPSTLLLGGHVHAKDDRHEA